MAIGPASTVNEVAAGTGASHGCTTMLADCLLVAEIRTTTAAAVLLSPLTPATLIFLVTVGFRADADEAVSTATGVMKCQRNAGS